MLLGPLNILCVTVCMCVCDKYSPRVYCILHRQVFQDIVGLSVITLIQG